MGTLFIVSTPIGNLQDITLRAITTLFSVDILLAENTTKTSLLLTHVKQKYASLLTNPHMPRFISLNEYEEEQKIPEVLFMLQNEKNIALVSEAGTPLLSDPGFKLVREAKKRGVPVVSIPGPSSLVSALSVSGLPTDKFLFLGFPPRSSGKRLTFFKGLKQSLEVLAKNNISSTVVLFESPHRLVATLEDILATCGDIEIVLAKELTKIHEIVLEKKISEYQEAFQTTQPRGEYILLFNLKDQVQKS